MSQSVVFWVSLVLAVSVPIVLVGGLWNRIKGDKGIGWQFIRFTVLTISLPIIAVLSLNNALPGEAAALIGGAMGYAFGKKDD